MTQNNNNFIMLPKVDFCFKELMYNPTVRKGFIGALLDVDPETIRDTTLLPTILPGDNPDDKTGILDVRVQLADGTQTDMEMQVAYFEHWDKRILFYLCRMYTEQLKKGNSYENLKKCLHVSILDFNHFPDDRTCYRTISLRDNRTFEPYSDLLEIKILELKKLPKKSGTEQDTVLDWMRFFSGKTREEMAAVASKNKYIGEAYNTLVELSSDEKKRLEYEAREKALRDYNSQISSAYQRGEKDGLEIGEKRGLEQAKMVFRLHMQGKTNEEIAAIRQIPIEKVNEILE